MQADRTLIPFNKPFIAGKELHYIAQAVTLGNIAGDGHFTQRCTELLEERFGIGRVLLTPSCTAALELAVMLIDLKPGDEVIIPSFTFVSTANAVRRVGATPVFVDIRDDTLNMDERLLEAALTERTRAVIPVHYAGVGCDMDAILDVAARHHLAVIEDAAQGVNASYRGRALGSIAQLAGFSFHETKNYTCGEGGALCINDEQFIERAEVLRDKGTNRQRFLRGEVDKYTWVDLGGSYVPSEIVCAFLFGQLELLDPIADRRATIYRRYEALLGPLKERGALKTPHIPDDRRSNYHMFYIILPNETSRNALMAHLRSHGVNAPFHYVPLHTSPMGRSLGGAAGTLPVTESISRRLLRLPFFYEITEDQQQVVVSLIDQFTQTPEAARAVDHATNV